MKKNILSYMIAFILCGCTIHGRSEKYNYTLRNESGKYVQIYAYVGEPPYVTNIFKLAHGEEINQKTLVDPRDSYSFEDFFNGTTIIITYDNERKQTYEWNGREPRNPYRRYGRNETVILTNEDYQEATPCNGSCD